MRKLLIPFAVMLLCLAPSAISQQAGEVIDSGTFTLTLNGQEVINEHFGITRLPDGQIDLSSSILLVLGDTVVNRLQRMRYDENFLPIDYFRHNFTTGIEEIIRVQFEGNTAVSTYDLNGDLNEETFTTEREFSLLDRNATTMWYGLVLRRELLGVDVHVSDTIQPTDQDLYESRLSSVGEVELGSGLDVIDAEELLYESGTSGTSDEQDMLRLFVADGRLIALVEIGSDEEIVIAYRSDLYPQGLDIPGL